MYNISKLQEECEKLHDRADAFSSGLKMLESDPFIIESLIADLTNHHNELDALKNEHIKTHNTTITSKAYKTGYCEGVRFMLDSNVDVNAKDNRGWTSLLTASEKGHADVVKMLCAANANVNTTAVDKSTALMMAGEKGHTDVVRVLLEAKANVHAKDDHGHCALFMATEWGREDVVEMLLKAGAIR